MPLYFKINGLAQPVEIPDTETRAKVLLDNIGYDENPGVTALADLTAGREWIRVREGQLFARRAIIEIYVANEPI
jgi:hypothetical protein